MNTTQYAIGWVSEPDRRGTWSLLYSCSFTIFLCVYSAIHINVPAQGDSSSVQFRRKAKWGLIAIFAPEAVLYSAWQQYYHARLFCRDLYDVRLRDAGLSVFPKRSYLRRLRDSILPRRLLNDRTREATIEEGSNRERFPSTPDASATVPPPVSLTYGFYVCMGGLVTDVEDIYDNLSRVTLTPSGVLRFARITGWQHFHVPDEMIKDKSKADYLAKTLVVLQVSWTLLQCISRASLGYPLTILEIHTLVHAACAMSMYGFWFRKPLNVTDPSTVDCGAVDLVALEVMRSSGSAHEPFTTSKRPSWSHYDPIAGADSRFRQYNRSACESSFVLFDTERVPGANKVILDTPVSITRPCCRGHEARRNLTKQKRSARGALLNGQTSTRARTRQETQSWRPDGLELGFAPSNITSIPPLHRVQRHGMAEARVLTTGQTLMSGLGPTALMVPPISRPHSRFRSVVGDNRGLVPQTVQVEELDPDLEAIIPLPEVFIKGLVRVAIPDNIVPCKLTISLSPKDTLRWHRAGLAFAREVTRSQHFAGKSDDDTSLSRLRTITRTYCERQYKQAPDTFLLRSPNLSWSTASILPSAEEDEWRVEQEGKAHLFRNTVASFTMVSAVYAGVHLALWNHDFPTNIERLLWRIASCTLSALFGLMCIMVLGFAFLVGLWVSVTWMLAAVSRLRRPTIRTSPRLGASHEKRVRELPQGDVLLPSDCVDGKDDAAVTPAEPQPQTLYPADRQSSTIAQKYPRTEEEAQRRHRLSAVAMENVPKLELSPVKIMHLDNDDVSAPEAQKPVISAPEASVRHGTAMHDSMDLATHTPVDTSSEPKRPKTLFYRVLLWLLIQGPWILMVGLVYPVFIWYATCRVFIVAESFLSLRRVPKGVYETVSWAQYIPHF